MQKRETGKKAVVLLIKPIVCRSRRASASLDLKVPNNENSSVKEHIYSCQNKDYTGIEVKIIMSENDPANLRIYEAFYIRKCKPTLNSREECGELEDPLF